MEKITEKNNTGSFYVIVKLKIDIKMNDNPGKVLSFIIISMNPEYLSLVKR